MFVRPSRPLATVLAVFVVLVGVTLPRAASAGPVADRAELTLAWIEGELDADGGYLTTSYQGDPNIESFDDWGLTIDAILALAAGGRGDGPAATTATALVEEHAAAYITGGFDPTERYAGAIAKTLLMAHIQRADPSSFGGYDLVGELLERMQPSGADAGRFSDLTGFGDFSNGFGQALAILALARSGEPVPTGAVDFLLAQQCPSGGFRGDYTVSGGCTDDAEATVDATGFALQALATVDHRCAVDRAMFDGVEWLVEGQTASGAFGGESGSNANSTGLAAVALRSLGQTDAADAAAGFLAGLQLDAGDDLGAVALNAAGFASAADGVQVLERDGFRRASTQGVLAFGLPTYGEIGTTPIDPIDDAPCVLTPTAPAPGGTLPTTSVAAGPPTLPVTGSTTGGMAGVGAALIALGVSLVVIGRRCRATVR